MTSLRELMAAEDWELGELPAPDGVITGIPIGYQTRVFLEQGAPIGQQRIEAVHAARNLLGWGIGAGEVIAQVWQALEKSPNDPAQPWVYVDVEKIVLDLASKPAPPPKPYSAGTVIVDTGTPVAEVVDDGFRFSFKNGVEIEISRIVATGAGTLGWVVAKVDGVEVGAVECELRTAYGVSGMWRFFEKWGPQPWAQMLEQARRGVLKARRIAGLPVRMDEVVPTVNPRLRVNPLIVNGHLNIIFAAGGSGKSLLLALLALLIQGGRTHAGMTVEPGNVLYLDWEQDAGDSKRTLDALSAGIGGAATHLYVRCAGPLVEIAEDMGRLIVEHDVDVVMIDSLTFALGGDKNDAQDVLAAFAAMRMWPEEITVIALDHVNKADKKTAGGTTIGSVMVENTARNLLRVIAWQDPESGELHQVLKQTKQNKGMIADFGLKYTFEPESMNPSVIFVQREDPPFDVEAKLKEQVERPASAPQRNKVLAFVTANPGQMWSKGGVAEALGMSPETARSCLNKLVSLGALYVVKGSGTRADVYGTTGA